MNDRLVLVRVTDPDVSSLEVKAWAFAKDGAEMRHRTFHIPVPEDGQLRADMDRLTRRTMRQTHEGLTQQDDEDFLASERLRAAYGLDTEEE